jgi:hypothetical protein
MIGYHEYVQYQLSSNDGSLRIGLYDGYLTLGTGQVRYQLKVDAVYEGNPTGVYMKFKRHSIG